MKKKRLVALAIMLAAVITVSSAYAYFTATDEKINTFTVGDLEIKLTEPGWTQPTDPIVPGDVFVKNPTVKSEKGDSYLRVIMTIEKTTATIEGKTDAQRFTQILKTLYHDTGSNIVVGNQYKESALAGMSGVLNYYNTAKFELQSTLSSPGKYVFYYKDATDGYILKDGKSAVLFTNVVIPSDWGSDEVKLIGDYKIIIRVEAIQSKGFANYSAAFSALNTELGL